MTKKAQPVEFVRRVLASCDDVQRLAILSLVLEQLGLRMDEVLREVELPLNIPARATAGAPPPTRDRARDAVVVPFVAHQPEAAAPALQLVGGGGRHPVDEYVDDPTRGWRA